MRGQTSVGSVSRRLIVVVFVALTAMISGTAQAGRYGAPVDADYDQTLTPSISYGIVGARSAEFAGITVNYGQASSEKWFWGVALAWDNEKSKADPRPDAPDQGKIDKRINTFTVIGTAGYAFHPRWDVSVGAGKGVADDDNSRESLEFNSGDWSVGSSIGWTFWQKQRRRLNLSVSLEYNLSQSEPNVSFDLGYGVSF